jgi:hypothetical protein
VGREPRELTPNASAGHLFGAELRHWRGRRGLSLAGLCERFAHAGRRVNAGYLAHVEQGDRLPEDRQFAEIADAALQADGLLCRLWNFADTARRHARDEAKQERKELLELAAGALAPVLSGEVVFVPYVSATGTVGYVRVTRRVFLAAGGPAVGGLAAGAFGPDNLERLTRALEQPQRGDPEVVFDEIEGLVRAGEEDEACRARTEREEVAMAAAESAQFAQFAEQTNVGPHTLEQFQADLRRIAAAYPNQPVYPMFVELRQLRDRAFELLEGRQRPDQTRDLYLVAGLLCGALANASFDLGWLYAAETQARTAFLCAELAGHNGLRAWVRGMQSLVAFWDDHPRTAADLAAAGWRYVPETGTARVRLAAIEARARGRLGEAAEVDAALARAEAARDAVAGADEPGGMLAFPEAKQLLYAASARLWLGGADATRAAEHDAAAAVRAYEQDPPELRRAGELCLAHLDLAETHLARDDVDGAATQVHGVLELSGRRRTASVARRLHQLAAALDRPRHHDSRVALDAREDIAVFLRTPVAPAAAPPSPETA